VKPKGNPIARELIGKVFITGDDWWRGIGMIPGSGLKIRPEFSSYDAERRFDLPHIPNKEPAGCICGEVLKGLKTPLDCGLFSAICTPVQPVGACMVSAEGTCATYYRYRKTA
jgi:hydrogenase expression/formation protein HypD